MYRFLRSPRWVGLGLIMLVAATTMVGLGLWQLDRYHYRSAINARIDAATSNPPTALANVLDPPHPARAGVVGAAPPAHAAWARVSVTGRYDRDNEVLARARTVDRRVGFEVITPLVLDDGTAILVDRGWVAPAPAGAAVPPRVPPPPSGEVAVVGRVRPPESAAGPAEPFAGRLAVRRIAPDRLAQSLPYALYGAYLTLEEQDPAADPVLVAISPSYENAAMNASYVVQWWLFAALTLVGFGYLAVREARGSASGAGPAREPHTGVDCSAAKIPDRGDNEVSRAARG